MVDAKGLIKFVVVVAFALIIFGSMVDYVGYYTSATKTGNVTGLGAVMLSFVTAMFVLVLVLKIFGYV